MVTVAILGHRRRMRRIVHAAALAIWAIGEIALLAAWAENPHPAAAARVVAWTLAGAFLAWNCGRPGAGRETVTVDRSHVVVGRNVGPFRFRRRYELARIRRPRLSASGPRRFRIEFDVDGRARRFGRNLTGAEASCIVAAIRRALLPHDWF